KRDKQENNRLGATDSHTNRLMHIGKMIKRRTPSPAARTAPTKPEPSTPPKESYSYKIKEGDTLVRIVTDLRAQGYKITQKQIMDANAGVNWKRLKVGQTVIIPGPTP